MWVFLISCLLFEPAQIIMSEESCCEDTASNVDITLDLDGDGFSIADGDCDDNDALVNPSAIEVCDGIDNNCDARVDQSLTANSDMMFAFEDADADGFGGSQELYVCLGTDGWTDNSNDCDDGNPSVNPYAVEVCDGVDNSCNGLVDDEDPSVIADWGYIDSDGDGYGSEDGIYSCDRTNLSTNDADCNDVDPAINPGVLEIPMDLIDQDCDGLDILDFSDCGTQVLECSEVLNINNLHVPFQRVSKGVDPLQRYEISSSFVMMSTEMTQIILESLGQENPSYFQNNFSGQYPVENISWHSAAVASNSLTGFVNTTYGLNLTACYSCSNNVCEPSPRGLACTGYRLPTNAEWEYASRAGTEYPFSANGSGLGDMIMDMDSCPQDGSRTYFQNNINEALEDYAWFCSNSQGTSRPVAYLNPNPWGFYDMQGNVAEWTNDSYLSQGEYVDPWVLEPTYGYGVVRGGAFWSPPLMLSNEYIEGDTETSIGHFHIGFRLMRRLND